MVLRVLGEEGGVRCLAVHLHVLDDPVAIDVRVQPRRRQVLPFD